MFEVSISQIGVRGCRALSALGKKRLSPRLLISMLVLSVCLLAVQPKARAQGGCGSMCMSQYSVCLIAADGDPIQEGTCMDNYSKCLGDCMQAQSASSEQVMLVFMRQAPVPHPADRSR